MLRKWILVSAVVVFALMAFSATAAAQVDPDDTPTVPEAWARLAFTGESPFLAMPISEEWTDLSAGNYHWYAFTYDFDEDQGPLEIRIYADPPESAVATVRNAQQARIWEQDGENEHFGCCVAFDIDNKVYDDEDEDFDEDKNYGDKMVKAPYMHWATDDLASGQYYIVVNAAEGVADNISYRLEVLGEGVFSEPAVAELPAEPVATLPAAAPMMAAVTPPAVAGESPFFAMPFTEEWMTLGEDQYQWYAFTYDFDELNDPLELRVFADPPKSAVVTVRNAQQARLWEQDGTHEHLGCCTGFDIDNKVYDDEDEDFDEDKNYGDKMVEAPYMQWAADELASGQYYIVVGRALGVEGDITYRLEVAGDGFFSEPAAVEPAAAPVAALPAAAPMMEAAAPSAPLAVVGESPYFAMPLTEAWTAVEPGQYQWYAFTYDFDELNDPLEIRVYADPAESASVTVRNAQQARLWEQDGKHEHLGCCTGFDIDNKVYDDEDDDFDEDKNYGDEMVGAPYMRWVADELASGQYYIVVGLAEGEEGPAMYRLEILGDGVAS